MLEIRKFVPKVEDKRRNKDGVNNQNEILFILGNALSDEPIIRGTKRFPNPPINTGVIMKKISRIACSVTRTLYNWWLPIKIELPACANSILIKIDIVVPKIPENPPKRR